MVSATHAVEPGRRGIQPWVLRLVEGALAIIVGTVLMAVPTISLVALVLVLGLGQLALGICQFVAVSASPPGAGGRASAAFTAAISIAFGSLVLIFSSSTEGKVRVAMGLWFLVVAIGDAIPGRLGPLRRWHRSAAAASAALAVVLLAVSSLSLDGLAALLGVGLLVRGLYEVGLGLHTR